MSEGNTYIFIGWHAPPLETIPVGWWAEYYPHLSLCGSDGLWYMVCPP